jgi:hypothetical protein
METIAVFYTPLASTKLAASIGLAIASHMAIVYTNNAGQSFGVSAGPSIHLMLQNPAQMLEPVVASAYNSPSGFGVLVSDPHNDHAFVRRHPEDYYTQDDDGTPYPAATVVRGADLAAQWRVIVSTYRRIGNLRLTYSPLSQNSNSVAGTALRAAGLPIPFGHDTPFVPAVFNRLPVTPAEIELWTGR